MTAGIIGAVELIVQESLMEVLVFTIHVEVDDCHEGQW